MYFNSIIHETVDNMEVTKYYDHENDVGLEPTLNQPGSINLTTKFVIRIDYFLIYYF